MKRTTTFTAGLLLAICTLATPAFAQEATTTTNVVETLSNAIGPCEGALPAYEQRLRQRPLAIVNESATNAFVNCAFTTEYSGGGTRYFYTRIQNFSTTPRTVTCTGVVGQQNDAQWFVKTVNVNALAGTDVLWHIDQLNGGTRWDRSRPLSLQCNLPSQTGLTLMRSGFVR